jgi:hypothetical protein
MAMSSACGHLKMGIFLHLAKHQWLHAKENPVESFQIMKKIRIALRNKKIHMFYVFACLFLTPKSTLVLQDLQHSRR